ncbi:MAG: DUF445 family protein [Leptospiraceae bacterium]|nr:DUF445 family protein [Leptospiraceae bacterium]MCP5503216.1 DUF445 family protein [Leptospiraceae bacterium]
MKHELSINTVDTLFRRGIVIITLLFGILEFTLFKDNIWVRALFVVLMAGIVGYFTNFLAIKMLFQPKQGKVLGWEGLVPKNKKKIARSLGNSIQNQLLAPEIILAYIYERKLIETGTLKLANWIDQIFQDEKVRNAVTAKIISVLKEKGPEIVSAVFDVSEETLKNLARNPEEIKKFWEHARERIVEYIKTEENREAIAVSTKKVLLEEIPRLSRVLNEALETYLHQKKAIGTLGMSLKKLVSFNDGAIQEVLEKFIKDPETSEQFMGMLDTLVDEFQAKLNSQETQDFILSKVEDWISISSKYARQSILPTGIDKLKAYLDDEKNWQKLDQFIFKTLDWGKVKVLEYMSSDEGQEHVKTNIAKVVHQINVTQLVEEQVMKLDTDELEKMILDNTGGNLVVIQVLGGVLGMIAGLIQVHILFTFPVMVLVLIAYIAHVVNKRKYEINK